MQRIGKGFGSSLPDFPALIRWQVFGIPLDLVEAADLFQGLGRQFALVGFMQIVELAPGVGHAANFGNAVAEPGLVAGVVVTHELDLPVAQEGAGMLTRPAGREVVNSGFQVRERRGAVRPDIRLVGFLLAPGPAC